MTVLILDDSSVMRLVLRKTLRNSNVGVSATIEAGSGAEALEVLRTHSVDLILCDWSMPGMSGREFLDRAGKETGLMPRVLIVTAQEGPEVRQVATALPRCGVVRKPFTADSIGFAVQEVMA